MTITADPRSKLYELCRIVSRMEPGECLDVDFHDLREIPSFEHNDATFTPADRVLGNIMGSAYTHSYRERLDGRGVTFIRHENTGERRHNDPDHDFRLARLRGRDRS